MQVKLTLILFLHFRCVVKVSNLNTGLSLHCQLCKENVNEEIQYKNSKQIELQACSFNLNNYMYVTENVKL